MKKKKKVRIIQLFNSVNNKNIIKNTVFDKMKEKTHICFTIKKKLTNQVTKIKKQKVVLLSNTSQSHQALNKTTIGKHGSVFTKKSKDLVIHKQVMCCEEKTFNVLDKKDVIITKKEINKNALKDHLLT